MEFLTLPENLAFTIALMVILIIAVLEGVGALFGAGLSSLLDSLVPQIEIDIGVEGPDLDAPSQFGRVLSWMSIGRVPILVLLIIFLAGFAISGLIIQSILMQLIGMLLPGYMAWIPALMLGILGVRYLGKIFAKIIPQDESDVISLDELIGHVAVITLGNAKHQAPAQAKVTDRFGQNHYVMLEPDIKEDQLNVGKQVLLVRRDNAIFYAIENTNNQMVD